MDVKQYPVLSAVALLFMLSTVSADTEDITGCRVLNESGKTYRLTQPVSSTGTCFTINASNVTLDCVSWSNTVTYGTSSGSTFYSGVYILPSSGELYNNDSTVRNCLITTTRTTSPRFGVWVGNTWSALLQNLNLSSNGYYGVYSNNANVYYLNMTNITVSGSGGSYNYYLEDQTYTYGEHLESIGKMMYIRWSEYGVYRDVVVRGSTVYVSLADDNHFEGVEIQGGSWTGFYNDRSDRISIVNGYINNSGDYGMYLNQGNHNLYSNIVVENSGDYDLYMRSECSNVTFLNSTYETEYFQNWGMPENWPCNLVRKWYLRVNVSNSTSQLQDAKVRLWNESGTLEYEVLTDSGGLTDLLALVYYINHSGTASYWNHTLNASKAGYLTNSTYFMFSGNDNEVRDIVLEGGSEPVVVTIDSPQYSNYSAQTVYFNVTLDKEGSWCGFSLDGGENTSMGNITAFNFGYVNSTVPDGFHNVTFYCNDTAGSWGEASTSFNVETGENVTFCRNLTLEDTTHYLLNDVFSEETCITVEADNVTLDCLGHTIDYGNSSLYTYYYGVTSGYNNTRVRNCTVRVGTATPITGTNHHYKSGIFFASNYGGLIEYVNATNNNRGILLSSTAYSTVRNVWTYNNSEHGILLSGGSSNKLINSTSSHNHGLYGDWGIGVEVDDSMNNTLLNVTADGNKYYGLYLSSSSYNNIFNGTAGDNSRGLYMYSSSYNNLADLWLENNTAYGSYLSSSVNNTFRNTSILRGRVRGLWVADEYVNDIDASNTINGKPVKYFDGVYNPCPDNQLLDYGTAYSHLSLIGCDNVTVKMTADDLIFLYRTNNSRILDSNSTNAYYGVYMLNSTNITLSNVTLDENVYGVYDRYGFGNRFFNLTADSNTQEALTLYYSHYAVVDGFTADNNSDDGISVQYSDYCNFTSIHMNYCKDYCLYVSNSNHPMLEDLRFNGSGSYGARIDYGVNVSVVNSSITRNTYGMYFMYCSNNTVSACNFTANSNYGVMLYSSPDNSLYNNLFNNTVNAQFAGATYHNDWNTTNATGVNVLGGNVLGGNVWLNPDGSGHSENCNDTLFDGFCDEIHTLAPDNVDYLPLSDLWVTPEVSLADPTTPAGNYSRDYVTANVSAVDDNLINVTAYLYNSSTLHATNSSASTPLYWNITNLPDDLYYLNASANDSDGNYNKSETNTYLLDTTPPAVYLESPGDDTLEQTTHVVDFEYNVSDTTSHILNCTFYLNGVWNDSDDSVAEDTTQSFTKVLANGQYNWSINCSDIVGNVGNSSAYNLTVSVSAPTVVLDAPVDGFNSSSSNVTFNCSAVDDNVVVNITLYGNWSGWHANETADVSDLSNAIGWARTLEDGFYLWNCLAYDDANLSDWGDSNQSLKSDSTPPTVNLVGPDNGSTTQSATVTLRYNVSDVLSNVANCSLYLNGPLNETDDTVSEDTTQSFTLNLPDGAYTWRVSCFDSVGNAGNSTNYSLTVSVPAPGGGGVGRSVKPELRMACPGELTVGVPYGITVRLDDGRGTGAIIMNAVVSIYLGGELVFEGKTDSGGRVSFTPSAPGLYEILTSKSGYRLMECMVEAVGVATTTQSTTTKTYSTTTSSTSTIYSTASSHSTPPTQTTYSTMMSSHPTSSTIALAAEVPSPAAVESTSTTQPEAGASTALIYLGLLIASGFTLAAAAAYAISRGRPRTKGLRDL